ncbi:hypothetical protein VCHA53O464_220054 [Vibrio chagasii]|nr:hypothetical protein VCHA53O464_220054 [Vibrio chagasii]
MLMLIYTISTDNKPLNLQINLLIILIIQKHSNTAYLSI